MPRDRAKNFGAKKGQKNYGNKGPNAEARKVAAAFRKFSQRLISDKEVQTKNLELARAGRLHPTVLATFVKYGAGEPPGGDLDAIKAIPVRVEHVYADDTK